MSDAEDSQASAQLPARRDNVEWLSRKERGALAGIRFVFWLATVGGRAPARFFVRFLSFYYALFDRRARQMSQAYLRRVGEPAGFWAAWRHIAHFSQVTLDRIFFLTGRVKPFNVQRTGHHHLQKLRGEKRGAILLGAHLGSFEAMRARADDEELPLNIVGHFANASMINALFAKLNPGRAARVLHIGDDPVAFALDLQSRVERGEMVAILGDRTGLNDKSVRVPFLGDDAAFPTGPFLLASALKCPVYLVFGLYIEPDRYELFCEPFAERIVLQRSRRQADLSEVVGRYAARVEHYARKAPRNWFNFFDFWA